jgi:hypothetical protein
MSLVIMFERPLCSCCDWQVMSQSLDESSLESSVPEYPITQAQVIEGLHTLAKSPFDLRHAYVGIRARVSDMGMVCVARQGSPGSYGF